VTGLVAYEHQALARPIDGAAAAVHGPDGCDLCAGLDLRRHLIGLAEQIRTAVAADRRVNGTPHQHPPTRQPDPQPEPADPPPDSDPSPSPPPQDRGGS
jgi:hypothetical protein